MAKRAPPPLPLDVLLCILFHLPPERTRADYSARAIARFSSCCRLFHDAACLSTLWAPHYKARFVHCDVFKEDERCIQLNRDWRLMYAARKRLERKALDAVQRLFEERKTRHRSVEDLTALSTDVWDVLSLEQNSPLPPSFHEKSSWGPDHGQVPKRPLSWRYWSERATSMISRQHAISELQWLKEGEGSEEPVLFEQAMTLLSCFFSVPTDEVMVMLDEVADACKYHLEGLGRVLYHDEPGFNPIEICRDICLFLTSKGFRLPQGCDFRALMNHFPHAYLTTHKRTIPLSMVHIFIYVAQHLGIAAYPVNFPGVVLARIHISNPPDDDFFLVNPCSRSPEEYVLTAPFNFVPPVPFEVMEPSAASPMLVRAARNIVVSLQDREPPSPQASHCAFFCALSISFLFELDDRYVLSLLSASSQLPPIECYTLLTTLAPHLDVTRRAYLEDYCQNGLMRERREAFAPAAKHHTEENVKYFVGMVFRHRKLDYYGCIVGWDEQYDTSEEALKLVIDDGELTQGHDQPFYRACQYDSPVIRYMAQEHVQIIHLTAELAKTFVTSNPEMSRYFSDVLLGSNGNERGVFRLSNETKQEYPDDDWYGSHWVQEGSEAASEQLAAVEAFTRQFEDLL